MDNPIVTDVYEIEALVRALDKYLITTYPRFVENLLRDAMKRSPHVAFAIALKYDMPQVADDAALETLRHPLFFTEGCTDDIRRLFTIISSERFTELMRYHFACVHEASAILRRMEVTTTPSESSTPYSEYLPCVWYLSTDPNADSASAKAWTTSCKCPRETGTERTDSGLRSYTVPIWVTTFMQRCRALLSDRPHWETLAKEGGNDQFVAQFLEEAAKCNWCRRRAQEELPRFKEKMIALVKDGIIYVRVLGHLPASTGETDFVCCFLCVCLIESPFTVWYPRCIRELDTALRCIPNSRKFIAVNALRLVYIRGRCASRFYDPSCLRRSHSAPSS